MDALLKDKTRLTEILLFHVAKGKTVSKVRPRPERRDGRVVMRRGGRVAGDVGATPAPVVQSHWCHPAALTRLPPATLRPVPPASQYIVNGSGQMPTMCEIPDPKRPDLGKWKVVICVDEKENGKNGAKLKIGQKCATVQGLAYEVRGGYVEKADIECTNGVIHVMDTVLIPDVKYCGV